MSIFKKNTCPTFSPCNGLNMGSIPKEISDLSPIELRLISRAIPMITVYRLQNGGQVIKLYN